MIENAKIEEALSQDCYDSIAFKGSSAQYLAKVIQEVEKLSELGNIYPPTFATWNDAILEHGLTLQPYYPDQGRLSAAEAVAIKTVADEGSAIAQNIFIDDDKSRLIRELTGNSEGWPSDLVDGISGFGYRLWHATKIRDQIIKGENAPTGTGRTIGEREDRLRWQTFETPLKLDNLMIGKNTVAAIVKSEDELVEVEVRARPEGAENEEDLQDRMTCRRRGIKLGAKIYQQVLYIAIKRGVSTTLTPE